MTEAKLIQPASSKPEFLEEEAKLAGVRPPDVIYQLKNNVASLEELHGRLHSLMNEIKSVVKA
jgi:hypothetical protein